MKRHKSSKTQRRSTSSLDVKSVAKHICFKSFAENLYAARELNVSRQFIPDGRNRNAESTATISSPSYVKV